MAGRRDWARWLVVAVALAALCVMLLLLGLFLREKGLQQGSALCAILAFFVAIPPALAPLWSKVAAWASPAPAGTSLDEAAKKLAEELENEWNTQERIRKVKEPYSLPVRWEVTPQARAAMAEVTWRDIGGRPTAVTPDSVKGTFNDAADLFVKRLPAHRLVVLGDGGAGKSVLALHLCLELLKAQGLVGRVPVRLSLASWQPKQDLRDFAAEQLALSYPNLGERIRSGGTIAAALVNGGRLLLVLDGLDEMKPELRAAGLGNLNKMPVDMPLVVTSRTAEYLQAFRDTGRSLPRAAVIELLPLGYEDIETYLADATDPPSSRWDPVFEHLAQDEAGPLALALQTPLMIWLARTIYDDADNNPAVLVELATVADPAPDPDRDRDRIEDHLISRFIPTIYGSAADRATTWLQFVAHHLQLEGKSEFAWWDLNRRAPRMVHGLLGGLPMGIPIALAVAFVASFSTGPLPALGYGLAAGTGVTLLAGLPGGSSSWRPMKPSRIKVRIRGNVANLARRLGLGLATGLGLGAAIGIPVGLAYGPRYGLLAAIAIGPSIGLAVTLRQLFDAKADLKAAVSPRSVLRADRKSALVQASMAGVGLLIGAVIAAVVTHKLGTATGALVGIASLLAYGIAIGLAIRSSRLDTPAYLPYLIARLCLATQGKLPLNPMAFLEQAHEYGVLRQQGAVYQFRHDRLQQYLTSDESANDELATVRAEVANVQGP